MIRRIAIQLRWGMVTWEGSVQLMTRRAYFPTELQSMSQRMWMLLMLTGFSTALLGVPPAQAEPPENEIAKNSEGNRLPGLVAKLGSRDFQEREDATKALICAGAPALEYLQRAGTDPDAEIRRRAGMIVARIEKDLDTTRLLKPKRIHLVYHDTPISEAVADFAKKSGYPLQFEGDRVRLAGRKITLDTGDVTFWEALDQFCRTAGLMEQHGPRPANPSTAAMTPKEMRLMELRMMQRRGMAIPPARVDFGRLVLLEGRENLPTSQTGGIRMRVLRPGTQIPGNAKSSEEAVLALEVSPEPSIDWRGVLETRVDKALDFPGRDVKPIQENTVPPNGMVNDMGAVVAFNLNMANNAVIFGGDVDNLTVQSGPPPREIPIRLKLNDRYTKALREIRGVVFAQVQSPQEPVIRADKILQAQGKTFKGPENSFLKIHEAQRGDKGQIKLRVTLKGPSMGEDALAMMQGAIFVRRFNGRMAFMAQQEGETAAAQRLALQDAKGQSFQLVSSEESTQVNGTEITQELRLVYQSKQGLEEPAQLIYSGNRLVTVEIPFTFKDVPLSE